MAAASSLSRKRDLLFANGIFFFLLLVYWVAPVAQVTDSNYSMLLSQDLLDHHSFLLDHYAIPKYTPERHYNTVMNGPLHQIEARDGGFYYYFPPGTSVLSVPFIAVMNAFGVKPVNPDNTHNIDNEIIIQRLLAALLMAGLAVVFYFTARPVLQPTWSAVIALGAGVGTQMFSTASRGMWTETWGIFLMGIVVWLIFRSQVFDRPLNPALLATLLAWTYFVRPTNAVAIIAITVWICFYQRRLLIWYLITGVAWLTLFVGYSWYHFHQLLPQYYLANRLAFKQAAVALPGNLISPSRGLLVFVPVLLFVGFLLIRYRRDLRHHSLMWLSLAIIVLHLVVITGFDPWHGGFSYGPRFTTGLVPWFTLLAILGIRAMTSCPSRQNWTTMSWRVRMQLVAGLVLLLLSVGINGRGALARETWTWNVRPTNVDDYPGKIWDWRQPQFLAGWVHPPKPAAPLLTSERVDFATSQADPFLWFGWSAPDPASRWTEEKQAGIVFRIVPQYVSTGGVLKMQLSPFLDSGKVSSQQVIVRLNRTQIADFRLDHSEPSEIAVTMPPRLLNETNEMVFELPDARSPLSVGISKDPRDLGIAVFWIQLQPQ